MSITTTFSLALPSHNHSLPSLATTVFRRLRHPSLMADKLFHTARRSSGDMSHASDAFRLAEDLAGDLLTTGECGCPSGSSLSSNHDAITTQAGQVASSK